MDADLASKQMRPQRRREEDQIKECIFSASLRFCGCILASSTSQLRADHFQRLLQLLRVRGLIDQVLEAIARSLDVIEAMVVYESDQHWLVSQMLAGKIDMVMLTESLTKSLGQKGKTPAKKVARRAVS